MKVRKFIVNNQCDKEKLLTYISKEMTEYTISDISHIINNGETDIAFWMRQSNGELLSNLLGN